MNEHFSSEENYDAVRLEQHIWKQRRQNGWSRRRALKTLFGATIGGLALAGLPRRAFAQTPPPIVKPTPDSIFRTLSTNRETLFHAFKGKGYLTPASHFFVRNHTTTPIIDGETWSLSIEGAGVDTPTTFSLDDLLEFEPVTLTRAIECAGNGRSFFNTQQGQTVSGTAWRFGAIGVGEWTGVRLADLLDAAGVNASAVDVLPEGLDDPVGANGRVRRPIPISRALAEDVLVVYGLNGELLPPDHGYPARLLVPGWIGIANIKWLGRIEVTTSPVFTQWNTGQYRFFGNATDYPGEPILTTQVIKSAFELPFPATLKRGVNLITGRSWSAAGTIKQVDVSFDNGVTYKRASIKQGGNGHQAWAEWQIPWTSTVGSYTLKAKAIDNLNNTQPLTVPFNSQGYLFSAIAGHPVTVTT
jgi:DMSO/TMAO reductase YedYZ molybdopterin-dependent catalytic subunit